MRFDYNVMKVDLFIVIALIRVMLNSLHLNHFANKNDTNIIITRIEATELTPHLESQFNLLKHTRTRS